MTSEELTSIVLQDGPLPILEQKNLQAYRQAHTPDLCPILRIPITKPVLDHDHQSGFVRGVVQNEANTLMGKVENYLRTYLSYYKGDIRAALCRVIDHMEQAHWEVLLHPSHGKMIKSRFKREKKEKQVDMLKRLGVDYSTAKNSTDRAELFLANTTKKKETE